MIVLVEFLLFPLPSSHAKEISRSKPGNATQDRNSELMGLNRFCVEGHYEGQIRFYYEVIGLTSAVPRNRLPDFFVFVSHYANARKRKEKSIFI